MKLAILTAVFVGTISVMMVGCRGCSTPQQVWVADSNNNRVLRTTALNPINNTAGNANLVIGQPDFVSKAADYGANPPSTWASPQGLDGPWSLALDTAGNLWVADSYNNRVLEFPTSFSNGMSATLVIGQQDLYSNNSAAGPNGLNLPAGIIFDNAGSLWVADAGNCRVLEFQRPFSDGMAATVVIGWKDFSLPFECGTYLGTQSSLSQPWGIAFDKAGDLFVADFDQGFGGDVVEFKPPFTNGMAASVVIGKPGFGVDGCTGSPDSLCGPAGIAFDSSGNLWVADELQCNSLGKFCNNRVLEFGPDQNGNFANGQAAILVLGQPDCTSTKCNYPNGKPSQQNMCAPASVGFDSSGDLFVADELNNRVLDFQPISLKPPTPQPTCTANLSPNIVIGQPDWVSGNAATTQNGLDTPLAVIPANE